MADDVNEQENSPDMQSGNERPSEAEEGTVAEGRLAELESLVAQKDEELAQASARVSELEKAVAGKEEEAATLRQSQAELEEKLSASSRSLADAVTSYRAAVVETNPEVMEELINGDTIEAINESLEKAKRLIGRVRQGLEAEISRSGVPAGAPERKAPDLSALSPSDKILYALGGRK